MIDPTIEAGLLRIESDKLRALLAWGSDPCIYCGLEREDMARCNSGFPGCARSDDMQRNWEAEQWPQKVRKARDEDSKANK
jgi:hypothetical protein